MSYRGLDSAARTALRRLGRLGLPDFPGWVVTALLDADPATAETVIEQLVDAHLVDYTFVDETGSARYRLHDLIRIYAREQAERDEPENALLAATTRALTGWSAVLGRLIEHIVGRATSGAIRVSPAAPVRPVAPELAAAALADPRGWLDAEQTSLVLAVELAAEFGLDGIAVELATMLCASGYPLNHVDDLWNRVHKVGLQAARRSADTHGEAVLVAALGQRRYEQDQFAEARRHLSEAVTLFRDLGISGGKRPAWSRSGWRAVTRATCLRHNTFSEMRRHRSGRSTTIRRSPTGNASSARYTSNRVTSWRPTPRWRRLWRPAAESATGAGQPSPCARSAWHIGRAGGWSSPNRR